MAAPFVAGSLALLAAARPDLPQPALRDALLQSAPRPRLLAGLLGSGSLNVAAALHRVLPGALWRSPSASAAPATAAVRLRLRAKARIRVGHAATVRWTASGAERVANWRVLLDGRRVGTRRAGAATSLRKRVGRAGTHRWKVVGVDATGRRVVAAARTFRVLRKR